MNFKESEEWYILALWGGKGRDTKKKRKKKKGFIKHKKIHLNHFVNMSICKYK